MIYRFIDHQGSQKNLPTVRFGSIAQMADEPVYQIQRAYHQESFLVETHSIGGASGAPVFVFMPHIVDLGKNLDTEDGDATDVMSLRMDVPAKGPHLLG